MPNNPQFSDGTVEASVNAETALANGGTIQLYSGTQPTDANTAITTQELLDTLDLSATAFAAATASGSPGSRIVTALANAIAGADAVATGSVTWARVFASNGTTVVCDCSVGTTGADIDLNTTALVSGIPVSITSFSISRPET